MKSILYFTSWYGIYNALMYMWQYAEKAELGYTVTTKIDTAICLAISVVVFVVVWIGTD